MMKCLMAAAGSVCTTARKRPPAITINGVLISCTAAASPRTRYHEWLQRLVTPRRSCRFSRGAGGPPSTITPLGSPVAASGEWGRRPISGSMCPGSGRDSAAKKSCAHPEFHFTAENATEYQQLAADVLDELAILLRPGDYRVPFGIGEKGPPTLLAVDDLLA
jgi:hypothetical protein